MSPAGMGVINNDTRRNIEKRYAALMGQGVSKPATEADEKALEAAQKKRQRKANRRMAIQRRARHAG